jgi:dTDP-4-amino-4,6-dideoxygalactose transaminase
MHLQPIYKEFRVFGGAVSEDLFNRGLCLPSGSGLRKDDLDRVVSGIRAALESRGN